MYLWDADVVQRKRIFAWAMYDWANSAFAIVVLSSFFPILYRTYWATELPSQTITLTLAVANSISSLLLMLLAVFLGAVADVGNKQKRFLCYFVLSGSVATFALGLVAAGAWQIALFVYVFATLAFMLGNVFYDALLMQICPNRDRERVSALGFALGYLGGGLFFITASAFIFYADKIGFEKQQIMRFSFYATAAWWMLFTLPLVYWLRSTSKAIQLRQGFTQFKSTLRLVLSNQNIKWFLVAYWLYIDGVDTIIRMAVDYGQVLGFDSRHLIFALILIQLVSFPATLLYAIWAEKIGTRRSIFVAIGVYILICLLGSVVNSHTAFYILAIMIGLVQGGIQSQSRVLFSRLIEKEHASQLFGVYNFLGKFAAVIGPILLSGVGILTQSPRMGIFSVVLLFIMGGAVLYRVSEPERE